MYVVYICFEFIVYKMCPLWQTENIYLQIYICHQSCVAIRWCAKCIFYFKMKAFFMDFIKIVTI